MTVQEIPRCPGNPLALTYSLFSKPTAFLEDAQRRLGDVFSVPVVGLGDVVLLCDPDHVREYFAQPEDALSPSDAYKYQFEGIIDPSAVLFKEGAEHSAQHKALTAFMGRHAGLDQVPTIRDTFLEELSRWPYEQSFSLLSRIARHANLVLLRIIAGDCGRELEEVLLDDVDEFLVLANSPLTFVRPLRLDLPLTPWTRLRQVRERFHQHFGPRVDAMGSESCVVRMMLDQGRTRAEICEEALTLFHSGQTMQKAPVWPVAFLLSTSAAEARLRQELATVLAGGPIEASHFRALTYLNAVVEEGIRHADIVPFTAPRIARRDVVLGGFRIPQGAWVAQCIGYTRVRPASFAEPHQFLPAEHFIHRDGRWSEWVPFGHGKRVCVGKGISEIYMAVILAVLFQREDLVLDGSIEAERNGGLRVPRDGLRIRRRRPRL